MVVGLDPLEEIEMLAFSSAPVGEEAQSYTRRWLKSGSVAFAVLNDGTKIRYVRAGSGPDLVLTHTVRTQLDLFQLVNPLAFGALHGLRPGPAGLWLVRHPPVRTAG
jgi:hypothetical protein